MPASMNDLGRCRAWKSIRRRSHLPVLWLLFGLIANADGTSCSSSPTCPAHASDAMKTCFAKGYSHFWGFDTSPFFKFPLPGKGLYTLAKTQKDVNDCCYDLEIQGFFCDVLRSGDSVSAPRALT